MPELPEVETVRRGLMPAMEGARITKAVIFRPDLRFPFPENFVDRLAGRRVEKLGRRGKYLVATLDSGEHWIMHLGMSGRFTIEGVGVPGAFQHQVAADKHVHAHFAFEGGPMGAAQVRFSDPRRFGYMLLAELGTLESTPPFAEMGPEPLSDTFTPALLRQRLEGRRTPLKAALLDQRIVAGLGNIYVCEALFRAKLSPRRQAGTVGPARAARLVTAIQEVLLAAIAAGGSTLRDYAAADGALGYFQHQFDVYGRGGAPCRVCGTPIRRLVQSGRSTFFCAHCQR